MSDTVCVPSLPALTVPHLSWQHLLFQNASGQCGQGVCSNTFIYFSKILILLVMESYWNTEICQVHTGVGLSAVETCLLV